MISLRKRSRPKIASQQHLAVVHLAVVEVHKQRPIRRKTPHPGLDPRHEKPQIVLKRVGISSPPGRARKLVGFLGSNISAGFTVRYRLPPKPMRSPVSSATARMRSLLSGSGVERRVDVDQTRERRGERREERETVAVEDSVQGAAPGCWSFALRDRSLSHASALDWNRFLGHRSRASRRPCRPHRWSLQALGGESQHRAFGRRR